MLFSVIIPTFNRAHLIQSTLRSVLAQSFKDYEIIVVDDGSTDHTLKVLAEFGRKVRVLALPNGGPSAARNAGVREAQGTYSAFLDSDDLWFPWALESYAEALRLHGSAVMLRACWVEFSGAAPEIPKSRGPLYATRHRDYFEAGGRMQVYVGAGLLVVRRAEFLEVRGFDTRLLCAEEHDLVLKLGEAPGFIEIFAPCQVAYRRHPVSATRAIGNTVQGARIIIEREKAGAYPGGRAHRAERQRIITRMARPVSLESLRAQRRKEAWGLFTQILLWHLGQGRWKYLLAFPLLALRYRLFSDVASQPDLAV
jgi:glycosyltransferase involved in cell wall biosynthesis